MMKISPLNDQHRQDIGIALGLTAALNYLRDRSDAFERLPGYNAAIAIVQEIEARHRAETAGLNFRAAAAAGIDIRTHMIGLRGRGEIFAEPMDLEQRAEFSASVDERSQSQDPAEGLGPQDASAVTAQPADAQTPAKSLNPGASS